MLGQVIGVEPGAIVGLRDPQPIFVERGERRPGAVEMIEDAEFHAAPSGLADR